MSFFFTVGWIVDTKANCLTDGCYFLFCLQQKKVNFIRDIMLSEYYFYARAGKHQFVFGVWGVRLRGEGGCKKRKNNSAEPKLEKITFHVQYQPAAAMTTNVDIKLFSSDWFAQFLIEKKITHQEKKEALTELEIHFYIIDYSSYEILIFFQPFEFPFRFEHE